MSEYNTIVFKVIPLIIVIAALLIVVVHQPIWRASCITVIAMMVVISLVYSNANERVISYRKQLESVDQQ